MKYCLLLLIFLKVSLLYGETSSLWGINGESWTPKSRLPDFSYAGYSSGNQPIPVYPVVANVKDFGAKGDGITDDTEAFNNALKNMPEGALLVPKGKYYIGGYINIKRNNITIRGEGTEKEDTTLIIANDMTTMEGRYVPYIYQYGGMIVIGDHIPGKSWKGSLIGSVVSIARRGDKHLNVSSLNGLTSGSYVILELKDDNNKTFVKHLYNELLEPNESDPAILVWPVKIMSVDSSQKRLELEEFLRFDIRPEWSPKIYFYTPNVKESGIENIRIECPDVQKMSHYHPPFNAINFYYAFNSWVKDVKIKNCDNSFVLAYSHKCTLKNTEVIARSYKNWFDQNTYTGEPPPANLYSGHSGYTLNGNSSSNLITDFKIYGRNFHDITVTVRANGNVFRNGKGVNISIDFHGRQGFENLFSNINTGYGTSTYNSSGPGPVKSGARNTYWNIRSSNWSPEYLAPVPNINLFPQTNIIPARVNILTENSQWFEKLNSPIKPVDLYYSQLYSRINENEPIAMNTSPINWVTPSIPVNPHPVISGENLIANPGFEDGMTEWKSSNNMTGNTTNICYATTSEARSGRKSLIMITDGSSTILCQTANNINFGGLITRGIQGGQEYKFEVWSKSEKNSEPVEILLSEYDKDQKLLDNKVLVKLNSLIWEKNEKMVVLNNQTVGVQIRIRSFKSQVKAYFDDFNFYFGKQGESKLLPPSNLSIK